MAGPDTSDPLIRQLREQISDNDRAIVEAVNARLKLVARLKRVKEERGIDFLDPAFAPGKGTPEVGGFSTAEAL